jgi:ankyrin repeat protein
MVRKRSPLTEIIELYNAEIDYIEIDIAQKAHEPILHSYIEEGDVKRVEHLISKGFNVNLQDKYGLTPLHVAVSFSFYKISEILIAAGADPKKFDHGGETALLIAAKEGDDDIVKLLIENGSDINAEDIMGWTILSVFVDYDDTKMIEFALEKGADKNYKNRFGNTALNFAIDKGNFNSIKSLVETGADIDHKNNNGDTVLHILAHKGKAYNEISKYLLSKVDNVKATNKNLCTILHLYAESNNDEMVSAVLKNDKSIIDAKDKFGLTALHYASFKGLEAVVNILIEHDACVHIEDPNGLTPLHIAVEYGNWHIINLLNDDLKHYPLTLKVNLDKFCQHNNYVLKHDALFINWLLMQFNYENYSKYPNKGKAQLLKALDHIFELDELDSEFLKAILTSLVSDAKFQLHKTEEDLLQGKAINENQEYLKKIVSFINLLVLKLEFKDEPQQKEERNISYEESLDNNINYLNLKVDIYEIKNKYTDLFERELTKKTFIESNQQMGQIILSDYILGDKVFNHLEQIGDRKFEDEGL